MKCSKCGTPYHEKDRYCENCGSKRENKALNFLNQNKHTIFILTIVIIIAVLIYQIITVLSSPEYKATNYLKAVLNNDTKKVYELADYSSNDFYSEEILKEKNETVKAANIQLIRKIVLDNEAYLTYQYTSNGTKHIVSVKLTKEDGIFTNWQIESGRVAKNITLQLPKNSTVKVDEIDIKKYLDQEESTDDYDIYTIDYMATGTYQVEVTLQDGNTIKDEITVSDDQKYSLGNIELTDAAKSTTKELTKNLLDTMYNGLINNNSASEITQNESVQKFYKDLKYVYSNSNITLNQIQFSDLELLNAEYNDESKLEVTFQTEYNYTITYQSQNETNTYSGVNRGVITVTFDYQDGYSIQKIESLKNSFPIRK